MKAKYITYQILDKQMSVTFVTYQGFARFVTRLIQAERDFVVTDVEIDEATGKVRTDNERFHA